MMEYTMVCETEKGYDPMSKARDMGIKTLSDKELLALMVGSGTKANSVEKIASSLEVLFKEKDTKNITIEDLMHIGGIGEAKAYQLLASRIFEERRQEIRRVQIRTPEDVHAIVRKYAWEEQERLIVLTLNGAHEVINEHVVTVGLVNMSLVHPREVFKVAVRDNATAIVISHNHPSGCLEASQEDLAITKRIEQASRIMGINLLDHIIVSKNGYMSFKEKGLL